jgi:hypothetical protein
MIMNYDYGSFKVNVNEKGSLSKKEPVNDITSIYTYSKFKIALDKQLLSIFYKLSRLFLIRIK